MNFFDYDLTAGSRTPPAPAAESTTTAAEPTLNEEVSQVVGQLGKLWGGFRKQSQSVLEIARKDLSSVVAQAQKEIGKLSTEPVASSSKATTGEDQSSETTQTSKDVNETTTGETEAAVASSSSHASADEPYLSTSHSSPFQSFFSRVQSSLPPNISSTLEQNLPASLKDSTGHLTVDFAQLKTTLTSEFQRVQGVTRAQAEEYVHKSEVLLKEAGEFLKDAVKVVPPEGQEGSSTEFMFDGTDIAFMPPTVGSFGPSNRDFLFNSRKGKGKETAAQAQHRLAGTRAAALLAQLKRDPDLLKTDPATEENVREDYEEWLNAEVSSKEGGMDNAFWSQRIKSAVGQTDDGKVLEATLNALVPSQMDAPTFWSRYFFKVHQIEKDEEKRKQLLAASGPTVEEEEFAWEEDEEDDTTTPPADATGKKSASPGLLNPVHASSATLQPGEKLSAVSSYPSSLVTSPTNTSPRESSDGYDVVSSASANVDVQQKSKDGVVAKEVKPVAEKKKADDEDDADSDWE